MALDKPPTDRLAGMLRDVELACDRALAYAVSLDDPQASFDAADALFALLGALRAKVLDARTEQVRRIWRAEELSLSHLAVRTGLSKSRVAQMTSTAPKEDDDS